MQRRALLWTTAAGAAATAWTLSPWAGRALAQPGAERIIPVVARRFVFLPNDIPVRLGETIALDLSAPEVVMGFHAPELKLRAVLIPDKPVRLRFLADRAGRFDFVCDIFCGDGHEGMAGVIQVAA